jgi:large conductance mechanosensitive channel
VGDARAQGSEDFLLRGHVVELAVAVVIGAASTAVVGQFAESL